jgi:hypothetical protein
MRVCYDQREIAQACGCEQMTVSREIESLKHSVLENQLEGTPHTGDKVLRYITPKGDVLHDLEIYTPDAWQQELFGS